MKTKRILGYTRDPKGRVASHSISTIANCVMGSRGGTTAVYVIEYDMDKITERCCVAWRRTEEGRRVRRLLHDKGVKYKYKAIEPRTDGITNTLTIAQKDNLIMEQTNYDEIELRPDSIIENLGDCRFKIDGRTIRFAIRKLTPRECFRLMDVEEEDIDKIQAAGISNSQQYKLAGNSIVVECLYQLFRKMFVDIEPEYRRGDILTLF